MSTETSWRLIRDGAGQGSWNMAVDETLWRTAAQNGTPTLRFYSWQPFCLSVGRLQKQLPPAALDKERAFDLVRRPSGGRAVWHAQEITYALAVPLNALPTDARSVTGAYEWLSAGFLAGLQQLGAKVEMAPSGVRSQGTNCFAASAGCDFLANGKKLIGAAQCRDEFALLQHGSLLLSIDQQAWQNNAGGPMESATSVEELGINATREEIITALAAGFQSTRGIHLGEGVLSQNEVGVAQVLEQEKYATYDWTYEAKLLQSSIWATPAL